MWWLMPTKTEFICITGESPSVALSNCHSWNFDIIIFLEFVYSNNLIRLQSVLASDLLSLSWPG